MISDNLLSTLDEVFNCVSRSKYTVSLRFPYSSMQMSPKSLITDDTSLAKVISACTSRGSTLGKIVVKTRKVDLKYLEEFVNLDEAYNRIEKFVETDSFTHLTEDEKLNTILFLKTAKQQNKEDSFFGGVPEDALADWLEQTKH